MTDTSKQLEPVAKKRLPPAAGRGRKKGELNKVTRDVKEMILKALEGAGGYKYLQEQAELNPSAFMSLLGRILPKEVVGAGGTPLIPTRVIIELVDPK